MLLQLRLTLYRCRCTTLPLLLPLLLLLPLCVGRIHNLPDAHGATVQVQIVAAQVEFQSKFGRRFIIL